MALQYFILQDGADFYVYSDSKCENLLMTRTAPFPVPDADTETATRARDWFIQLGNSAAQRAMHFVGSL